MSIKTEDIIQEIKTLVDILDIRLKKVQSVLIDSIEERKQLGEENNELHDALRKIKENHEP